MPKNQIPTQKISIGNPLFRKINEEQITREDEARIVSANTGNAMVRRIIDDQNEARQYMNEMRDSKPEPNIPTTDYLETAFGGNVRYETEITPEILAQVQKDHKELRNNPNTGNNTQKDNNNEFRAAQKEKKPPEAGEKALKADQKARKAGEKALKADQEARKARSEIPEIIEQLGPFGAILVMTAQNVQHIANKLSTQTQPKETSFFNLNYKGPSKKDTNSSTNRNGNQTGFANPPSPGLVMTDTAKTNTRSNSKFYP